MAVSREEWKLYKNRPGKWKTAWDRKIDLSDPSEDSPRSKIATETLKEQLDKIVDCQPKYPREIRKTMFTLILLPLFSVLNIFTQMLNHDITSRYAIMDLPSEILPLFPFGWKIADICATICWGIVLFNIFIHRHRWILVRRTIFITVYLFYGRLLCLTFTQLPSSMHNTHEICAPPVLSLNATTLLHRVKTQIINGGMTYDVEGQFCGDMFYSGHTIVFCIGCFTINRYTPRSMWPLRWMMVLISALGMICLIFSSAHYSIDVLVAYWLATGLYSIYHGFCETPHNERDDSPYKMLLLLHPFLLWLEENVPEGRIPNQLEWPFCWPQCIKNVVAKYSEGYKESKFGRCSRMMAKHRLETDLHS